MHADGKLRLLPIDNQNLHAMVMVILIKRWSKIRKKWTTRRRQEAIPSKMYRKLIYFLVRLGEDVIVHINAITLAASPR